MFKRVFVTVGTTSFEKLVDLIVSEKFVAQLSDWGVQEVRIQGGDSASTRNNSKWTTKGISFQFYNYKKSIIEDMTWADLIICHAGAGSTIEALDLGKILIVVPNETLMDNHQMELADKLGQKNYAFQATIDTFFEVMLNVNENEIQPFPSARPDLLNDYIINKYF